ncbi:MAG TPA: transketolase [Gemmatimonadales bacterium]|nr:transketolase [Gemmatimonadales bacterium]
MSDPAWPTINSLRVLAMDAVERAQSGHPGTPMALAPAAYVLWDRFFQFDPANPDWPNRDRFVLSCGHASMLIYGLLHLSGFDLSLEDIRQFRQWGSRTPGHPERGHTPGVETTTGPLGQGVGNAVGMAIAERILAERFNRAGFEVVGHRVWAFVSDGDLMEGVASEAASLAGHLRLGKLNLIYDDNRITIDGATDLSFSEDVALRFQAYGWHTLHVTEGNDLEAIGAALAAARDEQARPSLILLRTRIGDPAPTKGGTAAVHGSPLGKEEVAQTKAILGWPETPFSVAPEAAVWRERCRARGGERYTAWSELFARYRVAHPAQAAEWEQWIGGALPSGWDAGLPDFTPKDGTMATRQAGARVLNVLASRITNLVGGSADLAESTGAEIKGGGTLSADTVGRNIHWGIREHAMAASLNGIAAHGGLRPYGTTFLIFLDYCKPALRLSGLMGLPVVYVGTHDSIGLGEDGPTHQPIEQLAMLRATPNVTVIRPADATETVEAWKVAVLRRDGPTVLALSRQKLPVLDRAVLAPASGLTQGGYILLEAPDGRPSVLLIATGAEVHLALAAGRQLHAEGIQARVVSLPSWELFGAQPESYRDRVLPPRVTARVAIEAAASFGWERWVGTAGEIIALDRFGASAPAERLFLEFGFTPDRIVAAAKRQLGRSMS